MNAIVHTIKLYADYALIVNVNILPSIHLHG